MEFLLTFAFIPSRYDTSVVLGGVLPGGFGAQLWTFVTYALIHADWTHYGVNAVWLLPFGSAVARRFGALRFLLFFAATACGRRGDASGHPCRRGNAGDRRVGGDLRHHGGGDAICVPARRSAQFPPQRRRQRLSRAGDPAQRRAARSAGARLPGGVVRDQYSVRAGLAADHRRSDRTRSWPGRRISAAFSPACCCFPGSIPRHTSRAPTILVQCRNKSIATRR